MTHDRAFAREVALGAAPWHGRLLVLDRDNAGESTGHGSPLPHTTHGGPGRAGGGEELGQLRAAAAVHPIAAVPAEYSLWNRAAEDTLIPACDETGTGLVAWGPLGSGFLADSRFLDGTFGKVPRTDFRSRYPRFGPENLAINADRFAPLRDLAAAKGCTTGQLALSWLVAKVLCRFRAPAGRCTCVRTS